MVGRVKRSRVTADEELSVCRVKLSGGEHSGLIAALECIRYPRRFGSAFNEIAAKCTVVFECRCVLAGDHRCRFHYITFSDTQRGASRNGVRSLAAFATQAFFAAVRF